MTANLLDSISWVHRGGSVFSRQLSIVIYHPHDQQDEFIEALRKKGALQSLIESFGELLKGHQIRSRKDTTSNSLRKPSKHVTRFPLRGLVLEYMGRHWGSKRPGRGQSNASELTIARSDQLRGCCKKRYHQREEMRFWDIHTSYLALLACCNFRLSRTWGNVERPLDPLLKGPMCAFFALSKGQFIGFNGCWKDSWCLNAKIWSSWLHLPFPSMMASEGHHWILRSRFPSISQGLRKLWILPTRWTQN